MRIFLVFLAVGCVGLFATAAIGFDTALVFVLCFILSTVVLGWVLSVMARRQVDIEVAAPIGAVADRLAGEFRGMGWRPVEGRGDLNFMATMIGMGMYGLDRPVLSIDIEPVDGRHTVVQMWMSSGESRFGVIGCCDRIVSKRQSLAKRLRELEQLAEVERGVTG